MAYSEWKEKTEGFKKVDVRGVAGNFLEGIKKQAAGLPEGEGIEIVQTFEPIPLYEVMEMLGYEHYTEKIADNEYHAFFYRTEEKGDISDPAIGDPESGIAPGTAFEDIPDDWVCPICSVDKSMFVKVED